VAEQLRVRLVLHSGDLLIDDRDGNLANVLVFAARLLDAEKLRILLRRASGPLLVCVSNTIYQQVIAQRHESLDPADYEPVWLECKDSVRRLAWIRSPDESGVVARAGLLATDVVVGSIAPSCQHDVSAMCAGQGDDRPA
jgi:hypothetical protein